MNVVTILTYCRRFGLLTCLAFPCGAAEVVSRVEFVHGPLRIDHGKTVAEITAAQAKGGWSANYGVGLFINDIRFEFAVAAPPAGPAAWPVTTRISTTPVIYIARELPEDSCAYAAVLDHEYQHYRHDLDVLRSLPGWLAGVARDVLQTGRAMPVNDLERARNLYFQRVRHAYETFSRPRHLRLDNPISYARLGESCQGELGQRLASLEGRR